MECRHLDGNPHNNSRSNLEWGTRRANYLDKVSHGRKPMGSTHGKAKLSEDEVILIRHLAATGVSITSIAKHFDITSPSIYDIVNRKSWKHV
jgi:DNA invertase Pin-like site-specific DNA recombinase